MWSNHALGRLRQRNTRGASFREQLCHEPIRLGQSLDFYCGRLDGVLDVLEAIHYLDRRRAKRALVPKFEKVPEKSERRNEGGRTARKNDDLYDENVGHRTSQRVDAHTSH